MNSAEDILISREKTTLNSERRMSDMALKGHQAMLSNMLNGSMGQDMDEVLSGKRKVKLSFWEKLRYKLDAFLKHFK